MRKATIGAACALGLALLVASATAATGSSPGVQHALAQFAKYSKLPGPLGIPPIGKKVPTGKTIAMVGILNPVPEAGIKDAAAKLGWKVNITNYSPLTPDAYASGLQSTLQQKPDGVIFWTPFPLSTFNSELQGFKAAGIPVVTQGGTGYAIGGSSAVVANGGGVNQFAPLGRLYVDAAVGVLGGKIANAALVIDPSIPAWAPLIAGYKAEVKAVGGQYNECDVPLGDAFSGNAASKVVSYLQAHPTINELVFVVPQFALGVPQALSTAGLSGRVKLVVGAADNPTIGSVGNGTYDAAIVLETGTGAWREADVLARVFAGVKVYDPQLPTTFLIVTKKNAKLAADIDNFPHQPGAFLKAWGLTK